MNVRESKMKSFRTGGTLAWVGLVLGAIFGPNPVHGLEKVRIGLSVRNVVFLPFYYAKDKKIFEKHGLDSELIQMRSDLQMVGLVSGELDFNPAIGPATLAIAGGMPLKAVPWSAPRAWRASRSWRGNESRCPASDRTAIATAS